MASDVSLRIESILESAEEAAAAIRQDAELAAERTRRAAESEALRLLNDARRQGEGLVDEARRSAEELVRDAGRRAEELVAHSRRAAESTVTQAQRDADALVEERIRRISDLSQSVLERASAFVQRLDGAEALRRQLEGLVDALGHTAQRVAREAVPERLAEPEPEPPSAADVPPEVVPGRLATVEVAAPEPPAELEEPEPLPSPVVPLRPAVPEPRREPAGGDGQSFDRLGGARLVALQMAIGGSSRGDVAAHLAETFELTDSHEILDEVFGDEAPAGVPGGAHDGD